MEFTVFYIIVRNELTDPANCKPDFFQVHEQEPSNNHTSCHVVCPAACKAATEQVPRVIGGTE